MSRNLEYLEYTDQRYIGCHGYNDNANKIEDRGHLDVCTMGKPLKPRTI